MKFKEIPQIKDLEKMFYGLSKIESKLFEKMKKTDEFIDSIQFAHVNAVDSSTTQRFLKKLYDFDLIERKQINFPRGGYRFIYKCKTTQEREEVFKTNFEKWFDSVNTELELKRRKGEL